VVIRQLEVERCSTEKVRRPTKDRRSTTVPRNQLAAPNSARLFVKSGAAERLQRDTGDTTLEPVTVAIVLTVTTVASLFRDRGEWYFNRTLHTRTLVGSNCARDKHFPSSLFMRTRKKKKRQRGRRSLRLMADADTTENRLFSLRSSISLFRYLLRVSLR